MYLGNGKYRHLQQRGEAVSVPKGYGSDLASGDAVLPGTASARSRFARSGRHAAVTTRLQPRVTTRRQPRGGNRNGDNQSNGKGETPVFENARIGFIGVGRMGGGMARNLLGAGHSVAVYDPSEDAVRRCVEAGATAAVSAAEAVQGRHIVFTSVPMPEHLVDLYLGPDAVTTELAADTVCIDVSTVDPGTVREVSDALVGKGVDFLACPVGKGPAQAETGSIPLFVGGLPSVVERCRPVLAAIGTPLHHVGTVESATMFKLISNLVAMANLGALAEGHRLAQQAGIEPSAFDAALRDTGAYSTQQDMRLGFLAEDDHNPRFAVDLAVKDLRLGVDAAARWGQPVPVSSTALQQLLAASAQGHGGSDVTAMSEVVKPRPAE